MKIQHNKVKHSEDAGTYCTVHGVKVILFMLEFSSSKIIPHLLHVDIYQRGTWIGYYITISWDLLVQLSIIFDFNYNFLQWDNSTWPMTPIYYLKLGTGKQNTTKCKIYKVAMQTAKPDSTVSTKGVTERIVNILYSAYERSDIE